MVEKGMNTPNFETQRLIVRPPTMEDCPSLQKHFNNWNIIQHLGTQVPWPYPDNGAEFFLQENILPRMAKGRCHAWVIIQKDGPDEAIGFIDFQEQASDRHGNRGFWLSEDFHGRGIMTEALMPIHDFVFTGLGVTRFTICNVLGNEASRRVKQKTGAVFLEEIDLPHNNGVNRAEMWEVTIESWEAIKRQSAA